MNTLLHFLTSLFIPTFPGAAVAGNLLKHGIETTLFDINKDANVPEALRKANVLEGAVWANSAREAAEASDVVLTALPRPEHVSAAFAGDDGILAGISPGMTWIEHSTTDFLNTLQLKSAVEAKGAHCVEAPFTGGMQILREGKMVTLCGAQPEVLERVEDLIALSAPRIVRCGEFGHATVIKIWSNVLCAAMDVHIGECLASCKKAGLDLQLVFDAMRVSSGNSFCWETEVPIMLQDNFDPIFTSKMMLKDIDLTLDLTERHGVATPLTNLIKQRYIDAIEKFGEDSGSSIPAKLAEGESDCEFSTVPSVNEAFKDWSYTSEFVNGSYNIVHQGYDNVYLREPFTKHSPVESEVETLRARVKELEEALAKK